MFRTDLAPAFLALLGVAWAEVALACLANHRGSEGRRVFRMQLDPPPPPGPGDLDWPTWIQALLANDAEAPEEGALYSIRALQRVSYDDVEEGPEIAGLRLVEVYGTRLDP